MKACRFLAVLLQLSLGVAAEIHSLHLEVWQGRLLTTRLQASATEEELLIWGRTARYLDGVHAAFETENRFELVGTRWAYRMNFLVNSLLFSSRLRDKSSLAMAARTALQVILPRGWTENLFKASLEAGLPGKSTIQRHQLTLHVGSMGEKFDCRNLHVGRRFFIVPWQFGEVFVLMICSIRCSLALGGSLQIGSFVPEWFLEGRVPQARTSESVRIRQQ